MKAKQMSYIKMIPAYCLGSPFAWTGDPLLPTK